MTAADNDGEETTPRRRSPRRKQSTAMTEDEKDTTPVAKRKVTDAEASTSTEKASPSRKKRKSATKTKKTTKNNNEPEDDASDQPTPSPSRKKRKSATKTKKTTKKNEEPDDDEVSDEPTPAKKKRSSAKKSSETSSAKKKKAKASPKKKAKTDAGSGSEDEGGAPKKKKKAPAHQVLTERDELPKLWHAADTPDTSYTMKIASWNVAGLRALLKKDPDVLSNFVQEHNIDVFCLQETKLQEQHVDDPKIPTSIEGYTAHYSCSTAKKGYAGTCCFVRDRTAKNGKKQKTIDSFFGGKSNKKSNKKKEAGSAALAFDETLLTPDEVSYEIGFDKHDQEGRVVVLDFPTFTMCNVYVPNSGQGLTRLDYRVQEWDKDFLSFMQSKQKDRGVPVMWLGDLNVAHTNLEVWNDGAKHLPKQAGVTAEERASFSEQLEAGFVDVFRRLHPTAAGHYSYWSQRAGNRLPNKGLRLDYFICDQTAFDEGARVIPRDSYMLNEQEGSDHCPVILELELKSSS